MQRFCPNRLHAFPIERIQDPRGFPTWEVSIAVVPAPVRNVPPRPAIRKPSRIADNRSCPMPVLLCSSKQPFYYVAGKNSCDR